MRHGMSIADMISVLMIDKRIVKNHDMSRRKLVAQDTEQAIDTVTVR